MGMAVVLLAWIKENGVIEWFLQSIEKYGLATASIFG
jgi:hypothetical protein